MEGHFEAKMTVSKAENVAFLGEFVSQSRFRADMLAALKFFWGKRTIN